MAHPISRQANQAEPAAGGRGRGLSLLVIATAQLMLVLDDTVANIALPSIRRELAVSAALPWIINAYILAFGGLLLFGGRVGDLFGRGTHLDHGAVLIAGHSRFDARPLNPSWRKPHPSRLSYESLSRARAIQSRPGTCCCPRNKLKCAACS